MKSKGQENRKRIVAAANALFYRRGFNQTSFADVAAASGIPKGNFYYYFPSKDDLLAAVIESRIEQIQERVQQWEEGFAGPRERIKCFTQMLRREADNVVRYGCPIGSLTVELGKTQRRSQAKSAEIFDLFFAWLALQFRALGCEDPEGMTLHLLSTTQGASLLTNAYANPDLLTREADRIDAWLDTL